MRYGQMKLKKMTFLGMILAFALILSYVESLIPLPIPVPGIKLGLANLAVVVLLYRYGWKEALTVNLLRIVLSGFLFGNLSIIIYSLAGGIVSFLLMILAKKCPAFSILGVSVIGGIGHNMGQLVLAVLTVQTMEVAYYFVVLLAAGTLTGAVIGICSDKVLALLPKDEDMNNK